MSFRDFSEYIMEFNRLDEKLQNPNMQKKYYDKWMKKYAEVFKCKNDNLKAIEWDLRCRKALREIFSSATFFIEAKKKFRDEMFFFVLFRVVLFLVSCNICKYFSRC